MIKGLRLTQNERLFRWIDRRIPVSSSYLLNQKNIFIFPAWQGLIFPVVMASLWVLGTNYQNNLILALVFYMAGLFVLTIHHTFNNVSRLRIRYLGHGEAYAGQTIQLRFMVSNQRKQWAENIEFNWQQELDQRCDKQVFDFPPFSDKEISIALYTTKRGMISLPRMRIQSFFPLGIIRCWTWLRWRDAVLVYPKPIDGLLRFSSVSDEGSDGLHPVRGSEDYTGLKAYQPGDTLKSISWKTLAKGQGLFSKDFGQNVSKEIWLDLDHTQENTLERKLSVLCFWVNNYYVQNEYYGLKLLNLRVAPNRGFDHRQACLNALAKFQY